MGKVGLGDSINVQKEVPIPRLPSLPSEPQGDVVHRQYGGRVVFAVFVMGRMMMFKGTPVSPGLSVLLRMSLL